MPFQGMKRKIVQNPGKTLTVVLLVVMFLLSQDPVAAGELGTGELSTTSGDYTNGP